MNTTSALSPSGRPTATAQRHVLRQLMAGAPFQPATNLWRSIELPVLAGALPAAGRGLDVGCGDGVLTRLLGEMVAAQWRLVGVDLSPEETALARAAGIYTAVHTGSAGAIPEPDGSFDFAFANSVLEHIPDLPGCLHEIARCLRPGGSFLATVPSAQFHQCLGGALGYRSRACYLGEIDQRLAHVHYWTDERWRHELHIAGLAADSITGYLSRRQVQRWEAWSNWTGGLLYRLGGRRRSPIALQRGMGLRRGLPGPLQFVAGPLAGLVGAGVCGGAAKAAGPFGCVLVRAHRPLR